MSDSKIIDVIKDDAHKISDDIVKDAQNRANKMITDEEIVIQKRKSEYEKNIKDETQKIIDAAYPAGEIIIRNAVLQAKRKQIDKTINLMLAKLLSLSNEEYFKCIFNMILANKNDKKGLMIFNARDKERIPKGFLDSLDDLKLSDNCANIPGGVILDYGDFCEDLSFNALINEKYDDLVDVINKELFAKAEV